VAPAEAGLIRSRRVTALQSGNIGADVLDDAEDLVAHPAPCSVVGIDP
jgi:hypothetical protein